MSLHELLARVKAASEPDRELDAEIDVALFGGEIGSRAAQYTLDPQIFVRRPSAQHIGGYVNGAVPTYTTSIDAAVALIERALPGWVWSYHPEAGAAVWDNDFLGPVRSGRGDAETPALALIAAMLQAKIAEDKP